MERGKWNVKDLWSAVRHAIAPPVAYVIYEAGTKIVELVQSGAVDPFNWPALVAASKLGAMAGVVRFAQRWLSDMKPQNS